LRSPIDGRIGDRRVAVGNLVTGGTGGNTTLLATMVSVDPISVRILLRRGRPILRYVRFATASKDVAALNGNVPVTLKLIDEKDFVHTGKIDFIDNVIDRSSGTIRGRARIRQWRRHLHARHVRPVRVPGSPPYAALLVPDAAIGSEQARKYVLVVDADGTVRQKYVTPGQLDGGLRVIKDRASRHRPRHRQRTDARGRGHQGERRAARVRRRRRQAGARPKRVDAGQHARSRISSSTGRFSPPWSRSSS
jgi:multidrug efflux pump subunit AcrA (membrane-fusion protein)